MQRGSIRGQLARAVLEERRLGRAAQAALSAEQRARVEQNSRRPAHVHRQIPGEEWLPQHALLLSTSNESQ